MSSLTTRDYSAASITSADVAKFAKLFRDVHVAHRNATGERLSIDASIAAWVEIEQAAIADSLDPEVAVRIREFLAPTYSPRAITRVLAVVAANGTTAEGLEFLTTRERSEIEAMIEPVMAAH